LIGGFIFNIANLLLVAGIEMAGLAVAFPISIGIALVVGVVLSYALQPTGDPLMLFVGVVSGLLRGLFAPFVTRALTAGQALTPIVSPSFSRSAPSSAASWSTCTSCGIRSSESR
jgi:glucose uptake protein